MELYLLRHGASIANERGLVCGASDYPISEVGRKQANLACAQLSSTDFTHIYTSPLSRARDTISTLRTATAIVSEPALVELNTGDVSHITLEELWLRDPRYRRPWLTPTLHYPGGECMIDMVTRIGGWLEEKLHEWGTHDRVLIVGHEGTLRVILHKLLKQDLSLYPDFPIANCSYLHIEIDESRSVLYKLVPLPAFT